MKTSYLISNRFKIPGVVLFFAGIVLGIVLLFNGYEMDSLNMKVLSVYNDDSFLGEKGFFQILENSVIDELACVLMIVGGLIWSFSKEKIEDEFIYKLRKDSWVWAILVNYSILTLTILFVYGLTFFDVLIFNMFTPLVFFIARFNFLKIKSQSHEE